MNRRKRPTSTLSILPALGLLIALASAAGPASAQQGDGRPGKPPAEAIAACEGSTSGDSCSFSGRHGEVQGSCFAPTDKPLACRPDNAPKRSGQGQPQRDD